MTYDTVLLKPHIGHINIFSSWYRAPVTVTAWPATFSKSRYPVTCYRCICFCLWVLSTPKVAISVINKLIKMKRIIWSKKSASICWCSITHSINCLRWIWLVEFCKHRDTPLKWVYTVESLNFLSPTHNRDSWIVTGILTHCFDIAFEWLVFGYTDVSNGSFVTEFNNSSQLTKSRHYADNIWYITFG